MNELKVIILGCGSSFGVPSIKDQWGNCDSTNHKNYRTRSSILLVYKGYNILVDTSIDIRQQLLKNNINSINAVMWTHYHYDHVCGLNELRATHIHPINCYGDKQTFDNLQTTFSYCFQNGTNEYNFHLIKGPFKINNLEIIPIIQSHGNIKSLGFRIGLIAYNVDFNFIDDYNLSLLKGINTWILEASSLDEHESHHNIAYSLELINKIQPKKAIITNLNNKMDYQTLTNFLPNNVHVACDNMEIIVPFE